MKKAFLFILFISAVLVGQQQIEDEFLYGFLAGNYKLIGKEMGGNGTYLGVVKIVNKDSLLEIRRTINQKTIIGKGKLAYTSHETIPYLKISFRENDTDFEASYTWKSDFDNYARLSGYLYNPGKKTDDPGLEVLFIDHSPELVEDKEENLIKGLRTVKYRVADIDKGKEWYSLALGIKPYFDEPFYVGFNVDGFELGLDPDSIPPGSAGDGVVAYWAVDDIESEYKRLLSIGAKPHEEIMDVGEGIKVASVYDPFGNVFGIIFNPHFKE